MEALRASSSKLTRQSSQHMSKAQNGIGNNTRGTKHQQLVERAITQEFKTRQTNLAYDYDSVSHTWILECLALYKANSALMTFTIYSMQLWKTSLEANSKTNAQVTYTYTKVMHCPIGHRPVAATIRMLGGHSQPNTFRGVMTLLFVFFLIPLCQQVEREREAGPISSGASPTRPTCSSSVISRAS